ncbi:MAG: Crp/Fnr family transcriptional regulator [Bacteroidales bacterium]|nr:Crp/Fnr family transcriptional regulator [Bacteroidales bacterium]
MQAIETGISCTACEHHCVGSQSFNKEEIELLDPNKRCVHFSAGEIILKQGSLLDYIYYLSEGLVKVLIETDQNRNIILEIAGPGQYLGLNSSQILTDSPVSFIALTDCGICQIRKPYLMQVIQKNETLNRMLAESNGTNYRFLYSKLALFGSKNNHGRLAHTLLYLDDPDFRSKDIYSVITRKDIAELSAMSIESMNKIMKEFREDLLIEVDDKRIRVVRPDLLKRICRAG